jgi:transposase-like protein
MRQASKRIPESAEKTVRDIRRATRRHHSAEEKIRIVLEGLRGEVSIAELCRKEGINQNLYYRWCLVDLSLFRPTPSGRFLNTMVS